MGELSYFVGKVLDRVSDVFLSCYPQVLSCLNWGCRGIFETHKSPIQEREFYGNFFDVIGPILKTFVEEVIGY